MLRFEIGSEVKASDLLGIYTVGGQPMREAAVEIVRDLGPIGYDVRVSDTRSHDRGVRLILSADRLRDDSPIRHRNGLVTFG